jgi:hypothetical protein
MLTSRALVASILLMAACGGKGSVTPRGQRTASDCERLVRHTVAALAAENGAGAPTADQTRDLDAFVAERCADAEYLAWVNDLPDATFGCLLKAKTAAMGDACIAELHADEAPDPRLALPPPPPGPACSAFAGATDGSGTLIGVGQLGDRRAAPRRERGAQPGWRDRAEPAHRHQRRLRDAEHHPRHVPGHGLRG